MLLSRVFLFLRQLSLAFFYKFGLHCARNQIRVIIISDLVITSLLYPALATYFSTQPLSHYSTRLHDSLFALNSYSATYRTDLRDVWEDYDFIRIREDAGTQARCGAERTIRLERVLLPSIVPNHASGAINQPTIQAMLQFKYNIDAILRHHSTELPCVPSTSQTGDCLVAGPLLQLTQDQIGEVQDSQLIEAINAARSATPEVLFGPEKTLAGRGSVDAGGWIRESDLLVLTYFFVEDSCHANFRHSAWLQVLKDATSGEAAVAHLAAPPKLVALEYQFEASRSRLSLTSALLYIAYVVVFIHFSGSMKRMDSIHSRFGIAFAGIVEILASTVTSLSVCALWGFRVTMVPWGILPVMIVFVGAENMFLLVQEIVSTPLILPVKERVGIGLSRAGTSNTIKCICYNAIFGTMAVFSSGAIRQFCIFTVVVLVAHWFLIHTFFVAVLAIDLYRLDLADLIKQGPNIAPSALHPSQIEEMVQKELSKRPAGVQIFRRGRTAKNGSLILMLAITAGLYYASYPFPSQMREMAFEDYNHKTVTLPSELSGAPSPSATSKLFAESPALEVLSQHAAAERFWRVINPQLGPLVHLRIESPSLVYLHSNATPVEELQKSQHAHTHRSFLRGLRPLLWTMKIVVLPMSCTALALYALMRFLLKDADLSDAQRDRAEADSSISIEETQRTTKPVDSCTTFSTLSRAFAADVEMGAASKDGSVVAAVSVDGEIVVWMRTLGTHQTTSLMHLRESGGLGALSSSSSVVSITLNDGGTRCAIGTEDGLVISWLVLQGSKSRTMLHHTCNAVNNLTFLPARTTPVSGHATPMNGSPAGPSKNFAFHEDDALLVSFENGETVVWNTTSRLPPQPLEPSRRRCAIPPSLSVGQNGDLGVSFALEDGGFELLIKGSGGEGRGLWKSKGVVEVEGDSDDTISQITLGSFNVGPTHRDLVAVATSTERISVWDATDGTLVASVDDIYGPVEGMRLVATPWKSCQHCGEMSVDSFCLAISTGSSVQIYKAMIPLQSGRCSCPMSQLLLSAAFKTASRERFIRSRSSSLISGSGSSTSSPLSRRVGLPPSSSQPLAPPDYPVPAHGFHSRRLSEKEPKDRSRNSLEAQSDDAEFDADFVLTDPFAIPSYAQPSGTPQPKPTWNNVRVTLVADIPCDRGDWAVVGSCITGVRRKSRIHPKAKITGLKPPSPDQQSPFARWELWTFDPTDGSIRTSALSSLEVLPLPTPTQPESTPVNSSGSTLIRRHQSLKRLMELKERDMRSGSNSSWSDGAHRYPRLPFTRVSLMCTFKHSLLAACGNTIGLIDFGTISNSENIRSRKSSFNSFTDVDRKVM